MSIRVNITGSNNYKQAYRIENFDKIYSDDGPIIDMFSGHMPMGTGDYSLMTEAHNANIAKSINGQSSVEIIRNWMVVDCSMPGGKSGKFILDFGAESTVMEEQLLEDNNHIRPFSMVEYSSEGTKVSSATVTGGTGTVDNILGISTLETFQFGDILLEDLDVTILTEFPEAISKHGISGIIGRDILESAAGIKISNLNMGNDAAIEFLETSWSGDNADHTIVYNRAGGHFFVDGTVNDKPASFLIDTGAGRMFIDQNFISDGKIPYRVVNNNPRPASGLDGELIEYKTIAIKDVNIGGIQIPELEFEVMDMFVFSTIGLQNEAVLLGMEFFNDYRNIVFDFTEKRLLLWD
jgi:hypothetical protein